MKKLVTMIIGVALAIGTQAASFNWSAANIYNGEAKADGVDAYIIFADVLAQDAANTALSKGEVTTIIEKSAGKVSVGAGTVKTSASAFERADAVAGNAYKAYFVVFNEDKSTYFLSGLLEKDAQATSTVTFGFGNQGPATQGVAWTKVGGVTPPGPDPVPEPTSGLLLVLGGAALALRRKQK